MSTGYLAAFGTLLCWTISTFVLAKLSRLEDSYTLNKATLFFGIFILGIVVCIMDGITPLELFTLPGQSNWLWLSISGILGKSVGDYFGYKAIRILGVRRRSMITTLGPGFTWLFGLIILNETMNWTGLAAMLITIISLLLLINSTAEREEVKKENFGIPIPDLLFGIGASALTGLAFIISKMSVVENNENISAFHATWIRITSAYFALVIFDILRSKKVSFIKPFIADRQKAILLFLTITFGAVIGLSLSLLAITRMNAAAAYTIFSMLPVTVILVSVIVYKKKITFKSWLWSLLAVAGVIILVWRNEIQQFLQNLYRSIF